MERRELLLVDAFATAPAGGRTVVVDPANSLSGAQRRAAAGELGASGTVSFDGESLQYTPRNGTTDVVAGAVAGGSALKNRGIIDAGSYELHVDGPIEPQPPFLVEVSSSARVTVDLPTLSPEPAAVSLEDVADALGIDVAALEDVGADLPAATVDGFGGTLLVPVNFLQHLSSVRSDTASLATLLEEAGAKRLFAFTFDTLDAQSDVHGRIFDCQAEGNERAASGVAVGACVTQLFETAVFDGERESITVETGQFLDRPATVETTVSEQPRVSGAALTTLDASVGLPADDDDEILEA